MTNRDRAMIIGLCAAVVLAAAVVVIANTQFGRSDALARAVSSRIDQTPAEVLASAGLTADRLCVFGPYSTDEWMADELGFAWRGGAERTGIGRLDSHELVVAATDTEVVGWALVRRGSVGFRIEDEPDRCDLAL